MARRAFSARHLIMMADVQSVREEMSSRLQSARSAATPIRIRGAGTWMDAGHPCDAASILDTGALTDVIEYEPGDLTLTVGAGATLDQIDELTQQHGQWLTLDPYGTGSATIGATIATGSFGPLACAYGTPRDHMLGCEFVSGTGEVIRAGGRVVKNVAGFDLTRLATGAWGTIGVITEVTLRLRSQPQVERTLAFPVIDGLEPLWRWSRDAAFTPLALECISPALSARIGLARVHYALVRIGGNNGFVAAAAEAVRSSGPADVVPMSHWRALRETDDRGLSFRASILPAKIGELYERVSTFAESNGGHASATVMRGIVRCVVPREAVEQLHNFLRELTGRCSIVGERLDNDSWRVISRARTTDLVVARIKNAFDPDRILNPGILGA